MLVACTTFRWHTGCAAALLVVLLGAPRAQAECPTYVDASLHALDAQVDRDPRHVLDRIRPRLQQLAALASPPTMQLAGLYAIEAHAFQVLELDHEARAAANAGLPLASDPRDPVHLNLLIEYWSNVYDQAGLNEAASALAAARAAQAPESIADLCVRWAIGLNHLRTDRTDLAMTELSEVYRASDTPELGDLHARTASALSSVMRIVGNYPEALALNQESIDWIEPRRALIDLSVARFLRGKTFLAQGDHASAIEQLQLARRLSVQLRDQQGVAFADEWLCRANIELGHLKEARLQCDAALDTYAANHTTDMIAETRSFAAGVDLGEGNARGALATLNDLLSHGGGDLPAHDLPDAFLLRSRAHAALNDYVLAYRDFDTYFTLKAAASATDRARQVAAMRAQLEMGRQIERNATLQQELALSRAQLHWTRIGIGAGAIIITLLGGVLWSMLRYRRLLERYASEDGLTGLPNRRRTGDLARSALARAHAANMPLTLALLDFDYFKEINDRFGHAAGDSVLVEFARIARTALRPGDILGRWGGEEFLLVLPNCPAENASATVERLRALSSAINLPSGAARVSLSAGIANDESSTDSLERIIARADAALYEAKSAGRNLVRVRHGAEQDAGLLVEPDENVA
jgi:diguanylate cyclase (GGDEF)-like protein